MPKTFTWTADGCEQEDHEVANEDCPECWGSASILCEEEGCDGRVHTTFGDYTNAYEGCFYLLYCCDKCGCTDQVGD